MDALQGQAMSQEMERRRHAELRQITIALRRIEDGEYGSCESCGGEIAVKRLEFDPAAQFCIDCANDLERGAPRSR